MNDIVLSVAVVTYNHEKFLNQSLDSIFMQEVNFNIEVVIADDCSTDNSFDLIHDYALKYPHLINIIPRSENLGPTKNTFDVYNHCNGKYIALMETDDFWTNNLKLQKQVDFLENNPQYIACTHRYSVVDENGDILQNEYNGLGKPNSGVYTISDFENYVYSGHTGTIVFKNIFSWGDHDYSIMWKAHHFYSDITLNMLLTLHSPIYVLDDNMSAYRSVSKKKGTNFCSVNRHRLKAIERMEYLEFLSNYAKNEFNVNLFFADRSGYYLWWGLLYAICYPCKDNYDELKSIFYKVGINKNIMIYFLKQIFIFPLQIFDFLSKKLKRYF